MPDIISYQERKVVMGKPKRKNLDKKCLELWAKIVKHGGRCEICGSTPKVLHAHHLIGRSNRLYRYDPMNGIALCCQCHLFDDNCSAHASTSGSYQFLEVLRLGWPGKYRWFMENKDNKKVVKLDLQKVLDDLTEQWNSLNTKW